MAASDEMHPDLLAVQDKAWDLKEVCDQLDGRKLSRADLSALASVLRDLARLEAKLEGIRDKRKRGPKDDGEDAGEEPVEASALPTVDPEAN